MYKPQNIFAATQDLAREWVNHAAEGTSSQTDAVVRWALARINHADVPSVVHGVMLTLTGNKKTAKEARRTAAKAVSRATRTLSRQTRKPTNRPRGLLIALLAALIGAGAVLAWRTMMPSADPDPVKKADGPVQPPVPPVP